MIQITWNTDFEKEVVDAIRGAIGRDTEWLIVASSIPCSVCSLDPVTNTSTDSFCPVCSGGYFIPVYSGITISGHILWGPADIPEWATGGKFESGDCRVQVEYTPENYQTVNTAKYAYVDGKRLEKRKVTLRGVKTINRILVDLIQNEEE